MTHGPCGMGYTVSSAWDILFILSYKVQYKPIHVTHTPHIYMLYTPYHDRPGKKLYPGQARPNLNKQRVGRLYRMAGLWLVSMELDHEHAQVCLPAAVGRDCCQAEPYRVRLLNVHVMRWVVHRLQRLSHDLRCRLALVVVGRCQ